MAEVSAVEQLASALKALFEEKSPLVAKVKHPKLLLSALAELDAMIEMDAVKEAIVRQFKFLLVASQERSNDPFDGHMLHTVLYGSPGAGKSETGRILAKIYLSLGILKPPAPAEKEPEKREKTITDRIKEAIIMARFEDLRSQLAEAQKKFEQIGESCDKNRAALRKMREEIQRLRPGLRESGRDDWDKLVESCRAIRSGLLEVSRLSKPPTEEPEEELPRVVEIRLPPPAPEPKKEEEQLPIKIVSRADFVGEYVGHTAPKTIKLLEENLGGVVFIDEAYSLINGDRDTFGMEALTALNKFMSEHGHEIIVIFAGYKDLMRDTIFRSQPGLRRRCTWTFEIENYTPVGLAKIFAKQLARFDWRVDPSIDLPRFFELNKQSFPAFGGDTERFAFYCKLAYSECKFKDEGPELDRTLREPMLALALKMMGKNDAEKKGEDKGPESMYI